MRYNTYIPLSYFTQFLLSIILRIVSIIIQGKLIIATTNDNETTKEKRKMSKNGQYGWIRSVNGKLSITAIAPLRSGTSGS